jgi:hypothetical protein
VTLPKNLITAPCRNVAVVVLEISLPPSPMHAEVEGRRSAAASGQNSKRSSIRLITAQLMQAETATFIFFFEKQTATFIKQAETAYLIAVKLSPLSSPN